MPKETVHGETNDRLKLLVGWTRDRDVQIGLGAVSNRHLVDEFYGDLTETIGALFQQKLGAVGRTITNDHVEPGAEAHDVLIDDADLGRMILDAVTGSDYGMSSAIWFHPERHGCNEAIRLIRKGRTAAFGRDE